jgi:glycosyltransferase involved in cell wall biosynthesis
MTTNDKCFVVPVYNEEATIKKVITQLLIHGHVVVVDDKSTDKSISIIRKLNNKKIFFIRNKVNLGYAKSIKKGIIFAKKKIRFYSVTTVDSDDQFYIKDVIKISNCINNEIDFAIGNRNTRQRISEIIFSFISNFFYNIKDPCCGLKSYKVENLRNIKIKNNFDYAATDLIFRFLNLNYKCAQHNIYTKPRLGKSRFSVSIISDLMILLSSLSCIGLKMRLIK